MCSASGQAITMRHRFLDMPLLESALKRIGEVLANGGNRSTRQPAKIVPVDFGPSDLGPIKSGPVESRPVESRPIELLLVGGAAGLLTGLLPASRTTLDCDVMVYAPPTAWHEVEQAAHAVGRELGLPTSWLNSVAQMRIDSLPGGWQDRRVLIGKFGRLHVWAISRVDLIAMKFIAHRAQDLEDLVSLNVKAEDLAFVERFVQSLRGKRTPPQEVDEAIEILRDWQVIA
jgi:hypothetical protein